MAMASNWLEELVAEWLSIAGFVVEVLLPVQLMGPGGRAEPDVLGARIDARGQLIIRHCEVAAWPADAPATIARSYTNKFRPAITRAVEQHFPGLFGLAPNAGASYEQWLIFSGISGPTRTELLRNLPDARLLLVDEFIEGEILTSIRSWRSNQRVKPATMANLPADKWLLKLLDHLVYRRMLQP